ncbi:hypothetical protein EDD21DRAFT_428403 [Dissophora ornata]|nr:hypothetical protein EDD21DRAFT_428403 [Dissophora ornata]
MARKKSARGCRGSYVNNFIEGLRSVFEGVAQASDLIKGAFEDVTVLTESGQGFLDSSQESLGFSRKRAWYPALRDIDTLLRNGELPKLKTLICEAPCQRELAFQWGVCQRLGNLATDPIWDIDSRQGAVAFLGEIYRDDAVWGQETQVKRCIIDILMQLASVSGGAMPAAEVLLEQLQRDGDATKQALYQACRKEGPSFHPWRIALPLLASTALLDCVQNKPDVEADQRRMLNQQLERGEAIYILPQAKVNRQAFDDVLFGMRAKVQESLRTFQKKWVKRRKRRVIETDLSQDERTALLELLAQVRRKEGPSLKSNHSVSRARNPIAGILGGDDLIRFKNDSETPI